jgi:hypothetical protein
MPTEMMFYDYGDQVIETRKRFYANLKALIHVEDTDWLAIETLLQLDKSSDDVRPFYYAFPTMFRVRFPFPSDEDLLSYAWAGRAIADSVVLFDFVLDENPEHPAIFMLVQSAVIHEAHHVLSRFFLPESPFWSLYKSAIQICGKTMLNERKTGRRVVPFDYDAYQVEANSKSYLAHLAIQGMALLHNQLDTPSVKLLLKSNEVLHLTQQVVDDLRDWREDLANNIISFPIRRAIEMLGAKNADSVDPEAIDGLMKSSLAQQMFQEVGGRLERVRAEIDSISGIDWWKEALSMINTQVYQLFQLQSSPTNATSHSE